MRSIFQQGLSWLASLTNLMCVARLPLAEADVSKPRAANYKGYDEEKEEDEDENVEQHCGNHLDCSFLPLFRKRACGCGGGKKESRPVSLSRFLSSMLSNIR